MMDRVTYDRQKEKNILSMIKNLDEHNKASD